MDVSTPRYGRSCWPSLWNFVKNLGKSQLIFDGEMRWLRLETQPIFISHPYYIYKMCLTTFICCGCAYGCVHTTYCRSCWPSLWNFVRNLGYSQVITHGEIRWLRLHTQPIFISHPKKNIKGVWQPLYAVDVHMDVSPPRYGRSCRLSYWNFVRNLGYSQAITHG